MTNKPQITNKQNPLNQHSKQENNSNPETDEIISKTKCDSFLSTSNILENIQFMIETCSHENWFKGQMFDGMRKLQRIIQGNQRGRKKVEFHQKRLNDYFEEVMRERPHEEVAFWDFINHLARLEDEALLQKFLDCALNAELLEDKLLIGPYFNLFKFQMTASSSLPSIKLTDSNSDLFLIKLNKIYKSLIISLERAHAKSPCPQLKNEINKISIFLKKPTNQKQPAFQQHFIRELLQHQIFANNESLELNKGKINLFYIEDIPTDPIMIQVNQKSIKLKKSHKAKMKQNMVELMQVNSEAWFLNAHRFQNLQKILASYLSNYKEIYFESQNEIQNDGFIISMKHFEQILVFYEQIEMVCQFQNSMRFFSELHISSSGPQRLTNLKLSTLKAIKEILNIPSVFKPKLPILRKCINFEIQILLQESETKIFATSQQEGQRTSTGMFGADSQTDDMIVINSNTMMQIGAQDRQASPQDQQLDLLDPKQFRPTTVHIVEPQICCKEYYLYDEITYIQNKLVSSEKQNVTQEGEVETRQIEGTYETRDKMK